MKSKCIALLRGINVGGHKKVPMADLKKMMTDLGFENIKTLLNSGNVVFSTSEKNIKILENRIAEALEETFDFPVPVLVRKATDFQKLIKNNPFGNIEIHKDIRLYVTFLKSPAKNTHFEIPWLSEDRSYQIIDFSGSEIISVLDVSEKKTTDAMKILEDNFGKELTTRNWNTLIKLEKHL